MEIKIIIGQPFHIAKFYILKLLNFSKMFLLGRRYINIIRI
jgi:hypothetical protein